ncbi:hypothetical protein XENTR_v10008452 [Xenopus tropicalis]|nr:hypothetical protein XENTR_v10008452 [Xenopus tropicalis]
MFPESVSVKPCPPLWLSGFSRREPHVSGERTRCVPSAEWPPGTQASQPLGRNGETFSNAPCLTALGRQWMVGAAVQHQEVIGIPMDSHICGLLSRLKGMANLQPSSCCTAITAILLAVLLMV